MIDELHFGTQGVAIGGYKIITPDRIFSKRYTSPYKSIEQQKIDAGVISPSPSLMSIDWIDSEYRVYDPLDIEPSSQNYDNSLFRIFAGLKTNDDDMISFANQYGLLGEGFSTEEILGQHVEPISVWKIQVAKMKEAVELLDNIQQKNEAWLSKRVIWNGNEDVTTNTSVGYKREIGSSETLAIKGDELLENCSYGETEKPARVYLQRLINKEMYNQVTLRLLYKTDWSEQRTVITAKSLLGYMWLQLSMAIEGNLKYSKCFICGKPFRFDPLKRGKPRRFCSNACKSKDYRNRQKLSVKNE